MRQMEIKNISNSSVYIEDLGIRLNGFGATAFRSESECANSRSLKELSGLVSVKPSSIKPFWPFSKTQSLARPSPSSQLSLTSSPSLPQPISTSAAPSTPAAPSTAVDIGQLIGKMDELIGAFKSVHNSPISSFEPSRKEPNIGKKVGTIINEPSEPVYIPSTIIPEVQDISVKITEESQTRSDIKDAAEALKKLRKKK